MPAYTVTVGYDWTTSHFREIEIEANSAKSAKSIAVKRAQDEPNFWDEAHEGDGEASATEVYEVVRQPDA